MFHSQILFKVEFFSVFSCLDCFLLNEPVTSLAMSPLGEFLVTTHVDDLGLYLWSNMTLYTHVTLKPLPSNYEPSVVSLPSTSSQTSGEN